MQLSFSAAPVRSSPLPPRSGGEGSGAGGSAAYSEAAVPADRPPTPAPSPPRARARGGRGEHRARLCDLAARFARALPSISLPSHSEGAGNAGRPMRPIAACATIVVERTRVSQVTPESPGTPRAMVLRLIRALPGDHRLVATVACGCFRKLDASIGASGPHDFAVRLTRHSSKALQRPPHPAPRP